MVVSFEINITKFDVQKTVRQYYDEGQVLNMIAINYTQMRDHMKSCMDRVCEDFEIITVTRKEQKNVVMMSEESYNNLIENIHVMGSKANYDWLMESKSQYEKGKIKKHNLIETGNE